METGDYNSTNYTHYQYEYHYLEDERSFCGFESYRLMYKDGNGYGFLQENEELMEWYDVNLII